MKKTIYIIIGLVTILTSCDPRVELDRGQFGDHAFIDRVRVFNHLVESHELQEFFETGELTDGIRRNLVDVSTVIDSTAATAVTTLLAGTDLSNVAIFFVHRAEKIEPIGNAPKAGLLNDFSSGPYQYKLISADGTVRDWTLSFIAP
ncbi:hypothetical protein L3X37_05245 [Sabulilitoribacter arenilitoris]|uniref:DUF5018 domain-containing protein n=1 Tax=Wocania arenilitoris TaxID=2044858 RepID=A0AAE3ELT9_9FLAO|nr:hypothetical protein [Wocania arenilitoris]MCF7567770.1 hypothetical protein [Wocania arenilitoris]